MESVSRKDERLVNFALSADEEARMIAALVDELIPGDAIWPSASAAGVHGIIALRLFSSWDTAALEKFADLIGWLNGSLSSDEPMQRTEAVAAFEVRDPDLFDKIYTATVLAYYETPFVVSVIQQSGRPYSIRPHLSGYPMEPFDFSKDIPTHNRGHYLATDAVVPVDISELALETQKTENWGVAR